MRLSGPAKCFCISSASYLIHFYYRAIVAVLFRYPEMGRHFRTDPVPVCGLAFRFGVLGALPIAVAKHAKINVVLFQFIYIDFRNFLLHNVQLDLL